jgi:hypothetical protein
MERGAAAAVESAASTWRLFRIEPITLSSPAGARAALRNRHFVEQRYYAMPEQLAMAA